MQTIDDGINWLGRHPVSHTGAKHIGEDIQTKKEQCKIANKPADRVARSQNVTGVSCRLWPPAISLVTMGAQHVTHRTAILGQWVGQKGLSTRNTPCGVRAELLQVLHFPVQRTQLLVEMVIEQNVCRGSEEALT